VVPNPEEGWFSVYRDDQNRWAVSGLPEDSLYAFRVRAKNAFGWSEFSQTSGPLDLAAAIAQRQSYAKANANGMQQPL